MKDNGLPISSRPFTNHLKHLEEKDIITWIKREKPKKSSIKLKDEALITLMYKDVFLKHIEEFKQLTDDVNNLTNKEIYDKLEYYSINKAFVELYIKLITLIGNPIGDKKNILINWINKNYDTMIDIYLDEISNRKLKDSIEILAIHGSKMN